MTDNSKRTRLQEALDVSGLTQSELASRLEVSKALISQWLAGKKAIPDDRLGPLAQAIGVDPQFLRGEYVPVANGDALDELRWWFRRAPEDGGRDYGNSNLFATPPDIGTLVRETGQNSKDQRIHGNARLHFELIELHKGEDRYDAFLNALRLDELRKHIRAAGATKSRRGNKLRAALDRLDNEPTLRLLRIDDYGCTGLYGSEKSNGSDNPFAALIRNNLDSSKRSATAGGSFGLGKATLWRCSELSTVLFSSSLSSAKTELLRFIGKTELTWHERDGQQRFAGPGWLAKPGDGAESAWVRPEELAVLFLDRMHRPAGLAPGSSSGTSVLIVGFRDPRSEAGAKPTDLLRAIEEEAALNFWPAIVEEELTVSVSLCVNETREFERVVDPARTEARPFVQALEAHRDGELADSPEPGETAQASVELAIPGTLSAALDVDPDEPKVVTQASLLVRLSDDNDSTNRYLNHIAMVRGRGMVVKYWPRRSTIVGARSFHAVLLAGEACGSGPELSAAERFLRLSEPPAHDDWVFNEDLRDNYQRGAHARLAEFRENTTNALREIVRPDEEGEDNEPEDLQKLLRMPSGLATDRAAAQLRSVAERFDGLRWSVQGTVKVLDKKTPLRAHLGLTVQPESGAGLRLPWGQITIEAARGGNPTVAPDHTILIPEKTSSFRFTAISDPSPHQLHLERCLARVNFKVEQVAEGK